MSKKWNYAEQSKAAKLAGGPEKYVETIWTSGLHAGEVKMLPWIGIAAVISPLIFTCGIKGYNYFKNNKDFETEKATIAGKELIDGINEYDTAQQLNEKGNFGEDDCKNG